MDTKSEILSLNDVRLLVDTFYEKVRKNPLLAPVFNERIGNDWSAHLEKMYRFWQTLLLEDHTYFGSPFVPHAYLPIDHTHFAEWMSLFSSTIDELFTGVKASEAKWRAAKMAEMFESKIDYYRNTPSHPLL